MKSNNPLSFEQISVLVMTFAVSACLLASPLYAQADCGHEHGHWNKDKHAEFFEWFQSKLHDKLGITANQENAWKTFVAASKPQPMPKKPDDADMAKLTTPERIDEHLARMKDHEAVMEKRAEAVKAFYAQLTPAQQKIFDDTMPPAPPEGGEMHHPED